MKKAVRVIAVVLLALLVSAIDGHAAITARAWLDRIDMTGYHLPVLSIVTRDEEPVKDQTEYAACSVAIGNTSEAYSLGETSAGIRFRGNTTYTEADKKAYRIKFDKKQDLFGMGKAKSWVLLANAFDKTMVRNAIAFSIAHELGLKYTTGIQFVNVYLNGDNLGLYLLCEQVQAGDHRVKIEEDQTGKLDTGYLITLIGNGDRENDAWFLLDEVDEALFAEGVHANWRSEKMECVIRSPDKAFCTDEQIAFIKGYCDDFNRAILTHDWETFQRLCDVESFVKLFLVNVIMNNGDGGYQIYFYKKENGGKIYAGPVWDFDQSAGGTIQCTSDFSEWYYGSPNPWFDAFVTWEPFMELARKIYTAHIENVTACIATFTDSFYPRNAYDFQANEEIWHAAASDYWRITPQIAELTTFAENFTQLRTWFANRIEWLDARLLVEP